MLFGNGLRKFKKFERNRRSRDDLKDNDSKPVSQSLCDEIIAQTLILKKEGQYDEAIDLLELVANDGNPDCSQVAIYELALLHSQLGNFNEADKYLATLGFVLKLSNQIICPSVHPTSSVLRDQKQAPVSVRQLSDAAVVSFDNVLPLNLLQPLLEAFSPSSTFWSEHSYPTEEFFSYSCKKSDKPSLMSQIIKFLTPLIDSHFKDMKIASKCSSVEWWCHKRDQSSGFAHQLHFDLDENSLQTYKDDVVSQQMTDSKLSESKKDSETSLREDLHPLVSAVLYLSEQKNAAPTLVTDQTLDAGSVATQAWLCHPAENRLLLFDGKLLHGVVPFLSPIEKKKHSALSGEASPRITIMMGFWAKDFNNIPSTGIPNKLGPNMAMPSFSSKHKTKIEENEGSSATWPSLLSAVETSEKIVYKVSSKIKNCGLVHVPGPVWVPVRGTNSLKGKGLSGNILPKVKESSGKRKKTDDVAIRSDFISIEDLKRLREAPSVGVSDDEDDYDEEPKIIKKKIGTISGSGKACEDEVEYMSITDLNKLRASDVEKKSSCVTTDKNLERKTSSEKTSKKDVSALERSSDIVFVGKWFLKSESEIRNDVLQKL
jgi:tetratricopeptide (TPR) repeat protein